MAGDPKKFASFAGAARTRAGEELNLVDRDRFELCWIIDFPFYEWDEEAKAIDFAHNPFSMPQGGIEALTTKDPLDIKAFQYDMVCNGFEISSGGIRNHLPETMVKAFEIRGLSRETVEERFGGLYRAFQYGAPPHGGMAAGIDRIVMLLVRGQEPARGDDVPDEPAGDGPLDGGAVGADAAAAARAACAGGPAQERQLRAAWPNTEIAPQVAVAAFSSFFCGENVPVAAGLARTRWRFTRLSYRVAVESPRR